MRVSAPHTRQADDFNGRSARLLSEARELMEPAHRAAVDMFPGGIRNVVGYHVGWWDSEGRPCGRSGKAVRPALTLACAGAVGDLRVAIPAAVAIELVHDFSLLHDDVMDGDPTRRHRPSAWAAFGVSHAILAGDVLLMAAMQLVDDAASAQILSSAVLELCEGQAADIAFERRDEVTLAECLTMAEHKTGALLGAACQLGAVAAGADAAQAEHYRAFGRQLGIAFQLVDDLLGIWGDPQMTGKPVGNDLAVRKKSFPVVAALTSGTPEGDDLAELYRSGDPLNPERIARAATLIERAGARDATQAQVDRCTREALAHLDLAAPAPAGAADLEVLADLLTFRDH